MVWERGLGAASLLAEGRDGETGPGLYPAASAALAERGFSPLGVSAAGARLSFLLVESQLDDAVRALHQRFVGPAEG